MALNECAFYELHDRAVRIDFIFKFFCYLFRQIGAHVANFVCDISSYKKVCEISHSMPAYVRAMGKRQTLAGKWMVGILGNMGNIHPIDVCEPLMISS